MRSVSQKILRALPHIIIVMLFSATIIFLALFLRSVWRTIAATETLAHLRSEVATVALERARFDRALARLKQKMAPRAIDWKKLRDPF